jgi:hypothetical protein
MDLHVHTCLSPCAEDEMTPPAIAGLAAALGLSAIGVTDHNAADNAEAVREAGARKGIAVLLGMEVTSSEEAHLLAFFDDAHALADLAALVGAALPGANDPAFFGEQHLADAEGRITGSTARLLAGSCGLSLAEVVAAVHERDGIVIASHVDRPSCSVVSQLGFIPEDLDLDGVEVSRRGAAQGAALAGQRGWAVFSDAHRLEEIGAASTVFRVEQPTVAELRLAFHGAQGRGIEH